MEGGITMSNLTHLFKVGQKVTYRNNDFDAVKRNIPCIVKETYPDHIIITDTETDTDLWIEEGFNMDCVYPDYNMIGGLEVDLYVRKDGQYFLYDGIYRDFKE